MATIILNEYCLREIFGYCGITDYISLAQTCHQFKLIIQDILKHNLKEMRIEKNSCDLKLQNSRKTKINLKNLEFVVKLVHPFVKTVLMQNDTQAAWNVINAFVFPETTKLGLFGIEYSLVGDTCFPNLRTLDIFETIVKFKPQWSEVKNLLLGYSSMEETQVLDLFAQFKLKTLTIQHWDCNFPTYAYGFLNELEIFTSDPEIMLEFCKAFVSMPKLRKLIIEKNDEDRYNYERFQFLHRTLLRNLKERIVEIHWNMEYVRIFNKNVPKLTSLPKLRKIVLINNGVGDFRKLPNNVPKLKEIYISICFMEDTTKFLTNILIKQPELELIDLVNNDYYLIPRTITLNVTKIIQNRTTPVTLNLRSLHKNIDILLSAPTDLIKITKINPAGKRDKRIHYILE